MPSASPSIDICGESEDRGRSSPNGDFQALEAMIGPPMETGRCLRLAAAIAAAVKEVHQNGLVHKDIKPANILVNEAGDAQLTGFDIASRLPRERQAPTPPEFIAGTLAYMAPEQTGRMNRSIDSRTDLYAVGVTLYQMITGGLPFTASDPTEWVHCHIARRAVPPVERSKDVPGVVSAIVMKLLAKAAEDRYQTAAGVESDLRQCLAQWEAKGRIDEFALCMHDAPDRLVIPEKLFGREREIETLLAAFDRMVRSGAPELVLVTGYSGIGKSSVVNELHKALVLPGGLFASGKFDQYKRNIPYSTLAQAFQGLVRPLLGKTEAELARWRNAIEEALGLNARLIVDLVPELKLFIGDPPAIPQLPPQDAQRRFHMVVRRFIGVFARPEHPLALFLDDLQWLDAATLELLEDLLTHPDVQHLLLVGAYRDNEVDGTHYLARKLDSIRQAGARVHEIHLAPLAPDDVRQLIADSLHREPTHVGALAQLVHEKTAGNPFFLIQYLSELAEKGLLRFEHDQARWSWDIDRIHANGYTDNVVDLMMGKINRLPGEVQRALRMFACLGNSADVPTLSLIKGASEEQVHLDFMEAVQRELIGRSDTSYKFVHDRVQEAAYSLIPEDQRAGEHLRIGRLLAAHTPAEKLEEVIFEIVNHLNRGAAAIESAEERQQLAEFNLIAGRRAKRSTAYKSALTYLTAGRALLANDCWEISGALTFALEFQRAECEFLKGELEAAEEQLVELSRRAKNLVDLAAVTRLQIELFTTAGRIDRAVEAALEYLSRVGIVWSAHPTNEQVQQEYETIWRKLGHRSIESLLDLPRMTDQVACAMMDVLDAIVSAAWFTDERLRNLVLGRMVNISLEHGNSHTSCLAYSYVAAVLGPYFDKYEEAYRFGQLGLDLVEKRGLDHVKARVYMGFAVFVNPWTRRVETGRSLMQHAIDSAQQAGDLTFSAYARYHLLTCLLVSGAPLEEVQREAEASLEFVRRARFGLVIDIITPQLMVVRTLRGLTPVFGSLDETEFDERRFQQHLREDSHLAIAACWYWIRKLQARVVAGDYDAAIAAAAEAERLLWTSPSHLELAEYHYYAAVSRAALCDTASAAERTRQMEALATHHQQLQLWAANRPDNFADRAALVGAEIARLEGRHSAAMDLYEQAIHSARDNGFVHNEALANEIAARFYAGRGFEKIARVYLRDAKRCYLRWGADGKVRQLEELYPYLRDHEPAPGLSKTIGAPVEHLDLATVIKVSQAVSSETVLEKLIETLLRTALEQAGAERGVLLLLQGDELQIAAEATTEGDTVVVHLSDRPINADVLPATVLHHAERTRESVILDDAAAPNAFAADPYIGRRQPRSVLCEPLLNQAKFSGALYLENNLAPRVFAPSRTAVLKLLASQAAISLENTRLYRDLAKREAKIRRLVEADIIGIFIWDYDGRVYEANDTFLRMVGYSREDLAAGRLNWRDLTPPEWREADERNVEESRKTGRVPPIEKEYFRKDGGRVPVLIGAASFDEDKNQGVAFVLDLTERKSGEKKLRESEFYLAEAQRLSHTGSWANTPKADKVLYWSEEMFRILGLDPAQGPPPHEHFWKNILHPDDREDLWQRRQKALREKSDYSSNFRIVMPDGTLRYLEAIAHPVLDSDGEIITFVGSTVDVTDRKRAEELAQRSEKELRAIVESVPAVVWSTLPDGTAVFVNQRWQDLTGLPATGWNWETVVHSEDLPSFRNDWLSALRGGEPFEGEVRLRRADGDYLWFFVRAVPLRDESGSILKWYGTTIDIQDRKIAEEKLRESQFYLAEAQRLSKTGSWAAMPDDKGIRYWSEQCYRVLGFNPKDGLPTFEQFFQRMHPDDQPRFLALGDMAISERKAWELDYRILQPDGKYSYVYVLGHPVLGPSGDVVEFIGTIMDITERKQAEEALRRSEKELRDLIENMPGMAWILLPDGTHLYLSKQWTEYTGLTAAKTDHEGWARAVHPEDVEQHVTKWRVAAAAGQPFENEVRFRRVDGEYRWFLVRSVPLRDAAGRVIKWHGMLTDIEDRKHAEQALQRSEAYLAEAQKLTKTGSWVWDPRADQMIYCSDEIYRIFVLDPAEGTPTVEKILELVHPDDRGRVRAESLEGVRENTEHAFEYRILLHDGTIKHVRSLRRTMMNDVGEVIEVVGTTIDITERKLAEQALRRSEAALAEERSRFAREIHDTLAQGFTGILMQLGAASQIPGNRREDIATHLSAVHSLARSSLAEARRSVAALRPVSDTDFTLADNIEQLVQRVRTQTPADVRLSIRGETMPVQSRVANELSRITQEALNNALKHAGASRISVSLDFQHKGAIRISITDNGRGFDTTNKAAPGHFGIEGMQERASSIGASLTIVSEFGSGTQVIVQYRRTEW